MRAFCTREAYANLDAILTWTLRESPLAALGLAKRIEDAVERIAQFPRSAPSVELGGDVRVVTLTRYPYRIFYRMRSDAIEILHIRHAARGPWAGGR